MGLGIALLLLLLVSLGAYEIGAQYTAYAERTRGLNNTVANLKDLLDDVRIAEATELAALLTGEDLNQPAFSAAMRGVERRIDILSSVRDNGDAQKIASLRQAVEQFRSTANEIAAAPSGAERNDRPSAQIRALQQAIEQVQHVERAIEIQETDLAFQSRRAARGSARESQLLATLGCGAIFVVVLFSTLRIQRLLSQLSGLNVSLSQAADDFRQLADSVPQFVWKTASSGALEYVNKRWSEFSGGRPWQSLLHPDELGSFAEKWDRSRSQGTPLTIECRLASEANHENSRQYGWYLFRATPLLDKRTGERNWYCTFTDIGNQKNVEAALQRANQDLLQFAHAAAHDLQEPLRNISTSLGLLERKNPEFRDDPRMYPIHESIENAQRMFRMVQDLLTFAKADSSGAKTLVDPGEVLHLAIENVKEAIAEAGSVDISAGPLPKVFIDPTQFVQIFQNLLANSLKYRRPEQRLRVDVSADRLGDDWLFTFADNGIGFDQKYAKLIFGVFKRLHTRDSYGGNGMGLAICSRIVASNGGRMWAEGEEGVGARFFFTLPANPQPKVKGVVPPPVTSQASTAEDRNDIAVLAPPQVGGGQ